MTQRSLTALRIGNFKAFADTQRIPLKPITLIFGPNSAGKSSIIQSLAFAHEAQFGRPKRDRSKLDVYKTELGGAAIDLGGFAQFVHGHDSERLVEWGVSATIPSLTCMPEGDVNVIDATLLASIGLAAEGAGKRERGNLAPRVRSVTIAMGGAEVLTASYRHIHWSGNVRLRIETLNTGHPEVHRLIDWASERARTRTNRLSAAAIRDGIDKHLGHSEIDVGGLFGISLIGPGMTNQLGYPLIEDELPRIEMPGAEHAFWMALSSLVRDVRSELEGEYRSMEYLGPIRALPPRHFTPGDFEDSEWNAGGGQAWDRICNDERVREAVNRWLSKPEMKTPYRLKVRGLVDPDDLESELMTDLYAQRAERKPMTALQRRELLTKDLAEAYAELNDRYEESQAMADEAAKLVETWTDRLQRARSPDEREAILKEADAALEAWERAAVNKTDEGGDSTAAHDAINEDVDIDTAHLKAASFMQRLKAAERVRKTPQLTVYDIKKKLDVSHRDVGTGISQVLPVLVAAYGSSEQIIAMEQPEIHLHPALQAELGDVFVESALGERANTFILETHSEHLILRLLRRVREKKISPADMCVLFVEPTDHGSQVRELEYDENGDFIDEWPGGFFEEAFREKFAGR